jgi:CubicO group peptidase (beta-lactamase class C family)
MRSLKDRVDEVAEATGFSGVVRIDRSSALELEEAYGLADRAYGIPNAPNTMFAIASGSKTFTALVTMSLVEDGTLTLDTTARSLLGTDLPLISDDVTVEHLLAHRSGIGDYFGEEDDDDVNERMLPISVHELTTTERFLPLLDGHETVFPAGERFAYNNGGYVVLALIAERASGIAYHDLVRERVTDPAGMADTGFLRSDELPGRAARGYLTVDGPRTNVFHLPVLGTGDGGVYSTAADLATFWEALLAGRIVRPDTVAEMVRPRSAWPEESRRYGLGFHLHETSDVVWLEGYDAGVSFCGTYDPASGIVATVISNWSDGAWPLVQLLDAWMEE